MTEIELKEIEILLHYHEQYLSLAKQAENQLGHLNNVLIPVCTAATAFIVQQGFNKSGLFIGVIIVIIGFYGLFATTKYLQAYQKQYKRSDACSNLISQYSKKIDIERIKSEGDDYVLGKYKIISKITTLLMYQSIYIVIILLGCVSFFLSIVK